MAPEHPLSSDRPLTSELPLKGRRPPNHIAVEGPIGVGKTTLSHRLAEAFGHEVMLEEAYDNPFLTKFYENPRQVALATQLFFLFQRAQKLASLRQNDLFASAWVSDFMIEKDPLFARINLDADEYSLYQKVYKQTIVDSPTPDLVIYLQAAPERLLERIERRGLAPEQGIQRGYLEQLNEVYSEFFLYYDAAPLLIVNANDLDLANGDRDFHALVDYLLDIKNGKHYFNPTFFG